MARRYSVKLVEALQAYSGDNMGMNLGSVCIRANLPMTYVARVFGVSRPTMDTWFNGQTIKPKYHRLVELLMMALKTDLEAGKLPAKTMKEAKLYVSAIEQPTGELVPVSSI